MSQLVNGRPVSVRTRPMLGNHQSGAKILLAQSELVKRVQTPPFVILHYRFRCRFSGRLAGNGPMF